jgi:hypothetical protein
MIIFTEQEEWIKKNASSIPGGDYEKTVFDQEMRSCRLFEKMSGMAEWPHESS